MHPAYLHTHTLQWLVDTGITLYFKVHLLLTYNTR